MSTHPNAPRLVKGGLVVVDPETARVLRVISLQYNADTLSRTLQAQAAGAGDGGSGGRSEPLRFKGPAVETIKLDAEIDATDQLEFPDQHRAVAESGIQPQLALLESLLHPAAAQLAALERQANSGTLEIAPMLAPLLLFVWGRQRIVPVKITDFGITEEAFDPALNPIRARVSLGLRVMSVDDLGFSSRGGGLFMAYLQSRERLAGQAAPMSLATLGLGRIG